METLSQEPRPSWADRFVLDARWMPKSSLAQGTLIFIALQSLAIVLLESIAVVDLLWVPVGYSPSGVEALPGMSASDISLALQWAQTPWPDAIILDHVISIVAAVFSFFCCWDALVHKNTIQLVASCFFNLFMLCLAIIQVVQQIYVWYPWSTSAVADTPPCRDVLFIDWTIMAISGSGTIILIAFVSKLRKSFGWTVYKKLGANVFVQRIHIIPIPFSRFF